MEVLKPDATGIYVASHQATAAIEEAIEAEVPLIVAVAERRVGIVARSGTLSYEVGGDVLPGTTILDGLRVLVDDEDTEAIALIGEIGGDAEVEAASWIKEYRAQSQNPKSIAALVGGIHAAPGRIMGHAGAFTLPGEPSALAKVEALKAAGATIVNHPSRFGPVLKTLLSSSTPRTSGIPASGTYSQQREIHTVSRRASLLPKTSQYAALVQKRTIYLAQNTAFDLIRQRGVNVSEQGHPEKQRFIAVLNGMIDLFFEKEAFLLETQIVENGENVEIVAARFGFDDAAFRSCGRQGDIQELRDTSSEEAAEVEAEKDGIVYIKLDGNIGTLVNGAGLAMNTVDALADAGGRAANFLDTGGKATSATVKKSFQVILTNPKVKASLEKHPPYPYYCIFVNIFGGLTLGDMIARGVLLAFQDLQMSVPVVVRIRGSSNEKEGQRIIAESGLPLFAFDDFDQAASKAIELADRP
ncbi:hypothetical protein SLS62_000216 [Diatrype stigma]|uniref:ATP-citrate synthase/succinyl-CoA ligase C-terminal domain-containing protein n=1 Tax=Diatrype stigma TaxID=117547 RepID=A0AAN9VCX6_9PEZI